MKTIDKKTLLGTGILFWGGIFFEKVQAQTWDVSGLADYGLPSGSISGIIENVVTWILGIFGFLGIIAFVISGILYLTAGGDAEQEKKAKTAMRMGIMGIIVGLSGLVAIKAIDAMLNARGSFF